MRWRRRWRSRAKSSVIGGERLSLAGATHAQRLPDHRRHHVRHPPLHADARHAGGGAAGAGDRRARRAERPRSAGRARGRLRGDDADRRRLRTIRCFAPRAGTAPARSDHSARPPRSGVLRKLDAETMAKAFGLAGSQSAGTFAAWGTPTVKFHQCRGALSGLMAALLAEQKFLATKEFLTAQGRRLLQHLRERREAGGRHQGSRPALGARADCAAAVAVGVVDAGHEHRAVRRDRKAQGRSRARSRSCVSV